MMTEETKTKITPERCVEIGGHCWEAMINDPKIQTASYLYRRCIHCEQIQIQEWATVEEIDIEEKDTIDEYYLQLDTFEVVFTKPCHISEQECIATGGHCMIEAFPGTDRNIGWCKHCGHIEPGQVNEVMWRDIDVSEIKLPLVRY